MRLIVKWIGAAGLVLAAQACVVRETQPVNLGYYANTGTQVSGGTSVGVPQPYAVQSMPPDALYEQMTPSPGEGYVWIDGSWHWNGYEWVWVSGRWEREQVGYVYVAP